VLNNAHAVHSRLIRNQNRAIEASIDKDITDKDK